MKSITREDLLNLFDERELLLKPTQPSLFLPTIDRFYRKLIAGVTFPPIKEAGNEIIEGHHRYIALILANKEISTIPTHRTSATTITNWKSISIELEDPYSFEQIERFNKEDAKFINMRLDEFTELISKS